MSRPLSKSSSNHSLGHLVGRMGLGFALGFGLVTPLVASSSASATVVVLHELDEMTTRADVVIHARVGDVTVTRDEKGRIATLVEVEVLDALKGAKTGDVLTIWQLGGTYEGQTMMITGQHKWDKGEEMVFFAMKHEQWIVSYGVGVGKYHVERAADGVDVVAEYGDVVAVSAGPNGGTAMAAPTAAPAKSLKVFKDELRDLVKNPIDLKAAEKRRQLRRAKAPSIDTLRKSPPAHIKAAKGVK